MQVCFRVQVFVLFTLGLQPQIIKTTQSVPVFIFKNQTQKELHDQLSFQFTFTIPILAEHMLPKII